MNFVKDLGYFNIAFFLELHVFFGTERVSINLYLYVYLYLIIKWQNFSSLNVLSHPIIHLVLCDPNVLFYTTFSYPVSPFPGLLFLLCPP